MPQIVSPTRKRNVLWPVQRGPMGWITGTMIERYRSAISHLLRTPLGSIIWAPDFGTRLHVMRTQTISDDDASIFAGELSQAFAVWIPDIELVSLSFGENAAGVDPDSETLIVNIVWGIPNVSAAATRGEDNRFAYGPIAQTVLI